MHPSLPLFDLAHYEWKLALYTVAAIVASLTVGRYFLFLIPALQKVKRLNLATAKERMKKDYYKRNQIRGAIPALFFQFAYSAVVLPFLLTSTTQPWWRIPVDAFVILMVYDFVYYLTHRFLFHAGPFGGPLMWMHAVHHQQKNPCRLDSSYIHPLESIIGLTLYFGTVTGLAMIMGTFQVATITLTYFVFLEVNQHNHDLMETDTGSFQYLPSASALHHVHHARFTGGNFGTLSSFYDRLFGTYDTGAGWGRTRNAS
jgi:sterol desaturase/sphingolipid hydroxylase (fatty acid hydroxylase superfamily)